MRCVTRQVVPVVWLACGLFAAHMAVVLADGPPPKELSNADRERVKELYAKASALGKEGKFVEAQEPVQEILALCTRELGVDHRKSADYRREIEVLKKLAALSEADKLEYRKTYGFSEEIAEAYKTGRYADGLKPAEQNLAIYRRFLGPDSMYVAIAANQYATLLHYNERFADADKHYREAIRIVTAVLGEGSRDMASLQGNLALNLQSQYRFAEAHPLLESAFKITTRIYGEGHPETGVSLSNLASHYDKQGLYSRSEELYRRSVKAIRAAETPNKEELATACSNLALCLTNQDKFEEAETLFQEALKIRLELHGEDHPDTGRVNMNLGTIRQARGDIGDAEPYFRKAVDSYKKSYGRQNSNTAWALNNLAVNLDNQGRYKEGEAYLEEALAIVMRSPVEHSVAIAKMTNNMASCLGGQERYEDAEKLCERALETLRKALGPDHSDVGVAANNVAANLAAQHRYEEAERYLRDALTILRRNNGDSHSETAQGIDNLAVNLYHQGRFKDAERYFKESLAAERRVLGEGHPNTARTYKELVVNCCANGDYAQAAELASAATNSFEIARRRISYAGLNRARRAAQFSPLPALAIVAARQGQPEVAWQALEQNLARGLLDDLAERPTSVDERRREKDLLERLDQLDRQMALQADDKDGRAVELRQQRDAALTDFVRYQSELAARYGVPAGDVYPLPRIQTQLPKDTALIAWVELHDQDKRVDRMGDHWACVVRRSGPPVWIRLRGTGENGAWTDDDDRLVFRARRLLANRPTDVDGQKSELVQKLVEQRLAPLEKHLQATAQLPAVRHLIVLPCPRMASIPLEALTDKYTVSYAPSGTMLAWLQEHRPKLAAADPPRLLALGNPEFVATSDKIPAENSKGRREAFTRLPATQEELASIGRLFSESRLLTKQLASEQMLDQLASTGELAAFRYLHFATHGVLDDQRPMHSALILAPDRLELNSGKSANGRLTAEHILRRWKLNADLVTLSACDTGLGEFSGGEGYLGFSQALFLKGARSLVLSLWQVDDSATALLMARFYENLLGTSDGSVKVMSKSEALAEAKRWLRNLGPEDVAQLTKDLPTRGTRGRVAQRNASGDNKAPRNFEHPYFWSGFILNGDPQ